MGMQDVEITWLGHSTFKIVTPEDDVILVDPWLENNPTCPEQYHDVESDAILLTHGHPDHIGDIYPAFENCSGKVVCIFELANWLSFQQGIEPDDFVSMNKGGTAELADLDVRISMTDAKHSSSFPDEGNIFYLGEAAGFNIEFSTGESLYIAGDTCLFRDMKTIDELYDPYAAILPIGDHFTMDPEAAAIACDWLDVEEVIPCHWGTFDVLTGHPAQLGEALDEKGIDTQVAGMEPGDTLAPVESDSGKEPSALEQLNQALQENKSDSSD